MTGVFELNLFCFNFTFNLFIPEMRVHVISETRFVVKGTGINLLKVKLKSLSHQFVT